LKDGKDTGLEDDDENFNLHMDQLIDKTGLDGLDADAEDGDGDDDHNGGDDENMDDIGNDIDEDYKFLLENNGLDD